jgi:hypothetical protein
MTAGALADLLDMADTPDGVWLTFPTSDTRQVRLDIAVACNLAGRPVNIRSAANTVHVRTRQMTS